MNAIPDEMSGFSNEEALLAVLENDYEKLAKVAAQEIKKKPEEAAVYFEHIINNVPLMSELATTAMSGLAGCIGQLDIDYRRRNNKLFSIRGRSFNNAQAKNRATEERVLNLLTICQNTLFAFTIERAFACIDMRYGSVLKELKNDVALAKAIKETGQGAAILVDQPQSRDELIRDYTAYKKRNSYCSNFVMTKEEVSRRESAPHRDSRVLLEAPTGTTVRTSDLL